MNTNGTGSHCLVIHPYKAEKPDELSIDGGDVIQVNRKAEDGWWQGKRQGTTASGWFPSNFVYEPKNYNLKNGLLHAKAEFEYVAHEEDELTLSPGDLLTIVELDEDDGWHRGLHNGLVGLFPANFVSIVSEAEYIKLSETKKPAIVPINRNNKLEPNERRISLMPERLPMLGKSSNAVVPVNIPKPEKEKFISRAVITFDYAAQNPDELDLKKGGFVNIIAKEEDGWWSGTDESGNSGVFPYNFVRELPQEMAAAAGILPPKSVTPKSPSNASKFGGQQSSNQVNSYNNPKMNSDNQSVMSNPENGVPKAPPFLGASQSESAKPNIPQSKPPSITPNGVAQKPVSVGSKSELALSKSSTADSPGRSALDKPPSKENVSKSPIPMKSPSGVKVMDVIPKNSNQATPLAAKPAVSPAKPKVSSTENLNGKIEAKTEEQDTFPEVTSPPLQHATRRRPSVTGRRPSSRDSTHEEDPAPLKPSSVKAASAQQQQQLNLPTFAPKDTTVTKSPTAVPNGPAPAAASEMTVFRDELKTWRDECRKWMKEERLARIQLQADIEVLKRLLAERV